MSKKNKENEINEVSNTAVDDIKPKKNFKKLKFGSMSAAVIVLFVAIIIAVNIMCSLLMDRYPVKLDLTPDNRHEISEETINALEALDKDVEIIVTSNEEYFENLGPQLEQMYYQYYGVITDCPFDIIPEILDKYSVYASSGKGSVTVKYVDLNKNPEVATELGKYYSGDIGEGGIAVKCGERVKFITANEVSSMITFSQTSTQGNIQMVFVGESTLTSAVKSVADANPVRAAFAVTMNGNTILDQNHMQTAYSFEQFLGKNGYDCTEIDIASDALDPNDYDLLVIASTNVDFTDGIISKIGDFLYNGGNYGKNMIYAPNVNSTGLTNIDAFLEDWKISISPSFIADETNSVLVGQLQVPVAQIADEESVGTVSNESLPVVIPFARALDIVSKNNESIVKEVLQSNSTSYLSETEEKGAFNVILKSRKETANGLDVYGSSVLVIGSPYMLSDQFLSGANTYNNGNVVLNIVNNMTGKDAASVIPEKALEQYTLSLSASTVNIILVVTIIVIPVLIGIAGFIVLLWRKNK